MDLRRSLRCCYFLAIFLLVIAVRFSPSEASIAGKDINPPYPKAISVSHELFFKIKSFTVIVSGSQSCETATQFVKLRLWFI